MGKTMWKLPLFPGSTLSVGGKDVEIDAVLSKEDFISGKPFLGGKTPEKKPAPAPFKKPSKVANIKEEEGESDKIINAASHHTKAKFRNPMLERRPLGEERNPPAVPKPRHDPNAPSALVMKRPESVPKGKQVVDVVMDPFLCRHLRDHQREGVQFMYECVMGMRQSGEGAILADEMGLGKTLQTIALLWTLLKQNPIDGVGPVVKKALIVCPVTLIHNWRKEFRKWLGTDRLGVFVFDNDKKIRLTDFTKGRAYSVMIIGYEKLRTVQKELNEGAPIDIVIADEGHRLKTAQNKAAAAIRSLSTERRVVLSGTPLQNDLSEFFAMVDLVNPGLLGKYNTFKREFETPIVKARQPEATAKDLEKGEGRSEELARLTGQFILRRTADVIAKYLPPKTETILFCRPTTAQATLYRAVLDSPVFNAVLGSTEASLQLINVLKKLCNSPSLLTKQSSDDSKPSENISSLLASIPPELSRIGNSASAKLQVLDSLLHQLRTNTQEKIVLVSNYTSTLDILGNLLSSLEYPFLRLDGSTPASKRQALVDKFNKEPPARCFAFLLSAKAGGAGLNLIGASRLVLFDVDWNPATDIQAMARIHRDGQKNHCFIYRFLIKGALDEKIYQRQVTKIGLADAVVDSKKTGQSFSKEELKALFTLEQDDGPPKTHELLNCRCEGKGNAPEKEPILVEEEDVGNGKKGFGTSMDDPAADDESDNESLPEIHKLVGAANVNIEEQERKLKEKAEKTKMKASAKAKDGKCGEEENIALMKFLHVDVERVRNGDEGVEALVEDRILMDCLRENGSRVAYMFAKTTS
jgi:DNA repair and recombination protein RAD54B